MNRTPVFDSSLLLGFERTRALIERAAKTGGDAFPPFNIEQCGEGRIRITLAVAGFSAERLSVTVEENQLTIVGKREAESPGGVEREFLHQGIAGRGFVRAFVLADGLEIDGAVLEDGLLMIDASRPETAPAARSVPIRTAG